MNYTVKVMNRFKGLDLVDRVPEELWMEVHNIVQKAETKTIPKKKRKKSRMGKTKDLFKEIRDTKGTFHAKMGSIKDRNGMGVKKQKILRRGGKNTQKNCTKKIFKTKVIMMV